MFFPTIASRARRIGSLAANRRRCIAVILGASVLAVSGCSQMPLKEGERARLMRGIHTPRDRNNMDITIHRMPVTAWPKCLEFIGRKSPLLAVASAVTLSVVHACARVPRDSKLRPGQRPWCIVAVPEGDDEALEHELRHCEGWDHPREPRIDYTGDPDQPHLVSENVADR